MVECAFRAIPFISLSKFLDIKKPRLIMARANIISGGDGRGMDSTSPKYYKLTKTEVGVAGDIKTDKYVTYPHPS
jgi:hypothetical protein